MDYSISQVAEQTGLSVHTLRFYDREGLIPEVHRVNGRRRYTDADLRWIRILCCLKSTGMPLNDIKQYVELCKRGDETLTQRRAMILKQREIVTKQIEALKEPLRAIEHKIAYYDEATTITCE